MLIHFEVCFIYCRCAQRITRSRRAKHGLQLLDGQREHRFVMNGLRPLADCQLYTFVDTAYLHGRDPAGICQQLCDGGSDLIQLRAKNSTADEIRGMAEKLLPITARANVWLVINDYPEIAKELDAPICHLGQEDFFDSGHKHVSEISRDTLIGLSTHAPAQAERAVAAGCAYVAIGPIYATGTKPTAKPVTLDYVRWAAANVKVPWFAIGGINLQTIDAVVEAGARRICVVSAILNSPDIAGACREFKRRLPAR
jgi:thiamine-phosphate pyrophosphorylase